MSEIQKDLHKQINRRSAAILNSFVEKNLIKADKHLDIKKGKLKDVPGERWITIQGNRIIIGSTPGKAGELHTKTVPASIGGRPFKPGNPTNDSAEY